jgi:hypothetical protein
MTTRTEATEGQAKIRQLLTDLRYGHFDSDAIGEINSMLDQALAILDASPPIVGEPDEAEVERIGKLISADHEFYRDAIGVTNILDIVRTTMRLAQAPQSSPATVARVYTERSAGKWHAGLNIGNQSFTLH